jgi:hypothetical protein
MTKFDWLSFTHIFQELNQKENQIFKEVSKCCDGFFSIQEFIDGEEYESVEFHF